MAAPTFVTASTGSTDATGAWAHTSAVPSAVGNVYIVQVLIDGVAGGTVSIDSVTNAENLAGTDNVLLEFPDLYAVGSPQAGNQKLWIGRSTSTSAMVITGSNTSGDDLYIRAYEFTNVSTGTTLATVIEETTAGTVTNGAATSATCADTSVTTLGVDRLACNFGAITDDASGIALFAGATGGTWAHFQSYETAGGTDGTVFFEDAAMATAGTINGGSDTITSLPWGVVGFALIGTTVAGSFIEIKDPWPALQAVKRASTW